MSIDSIVAFERCNDYGPSVRKSVERLFANLGGLEGMITRGQEIIIKPNLLTDRFPEQAVTTHPEVVRAIIRILKDFGAKPSVADSPSNVVKIEKVWQKTGFATMCREENTPLLNLEKCGSVHFNTEGGSFSIAKPLLDTGFLINVPKVKTHTLTVLTAAVKNMYGSIPGLQKATLHKIHPTVPEFAKLLASIYTKVPPHLNIADGIIGMEGDGPSAGNPTHLGFLAASRDAVIMDLALCKLLNLDCTKIDYLKLLAKDGDVKNALAGIKYAGATPDEFIKHTFKAPGTMLTTLIPRWIVRILEPYIWFAPEFSDKCTMCGRCVKACPVGALSAEPKQKPVLQRKKCIGCCCCHEICPATAITMGKSPLLKLVLRGRM